MYKEKILKLLRSSKTGFRSGEELASKMGISRTMVWKHIKALEREGFGIEGVPSLGYRITTTPDLLRLEDIQQGLTTKTIGRDIRLVAQTASTNTLAMELASQGAPEGTVVVAETQTAGKGRLGRAWISPRGNLYCSIILRPNVPISKAPLITLMGAVATASAIRTACRLPASIKWPNDILLSARKAAGLLTELSAEPDRIRHIVLGIGVDVNMELEELPAAIRDITTTLSREAGKKIDRIALLREMLRSLEHWYGEFIRNDRAVLKEWEALNVTTGNRVAVSGAGESLEGLAQGIDNEGRLLIKSDDGVVRTVAAGDVTLLKKNTSGIQDPES
jgi:BirA family biotin operon repressor/biotin-[acetyl-CoA-carboxylase] ligase